LSARSNEILTAVVQGARKEETNPDVNLAAMRALYNSLEFVRENFEREVCKFNALKPKDLISHTNVFGRASVIS